MFCKYNLSLFFVVMLLGCSFYPPQPIYMSGQVTDAETGRPLSGAYVFIRWNDGPAPFDSVPACAHIGGAITGVDGRYSILAFKGHVNNSKTIYKVGYSVTQGTTKLMAFSGTLNERLSEMTSRLGEYMYCPSGDNNLVVQALESAYAEVLNIPQSPQNILNGSALAGDDSVNGETVFGLRGMVDDQIEWVKNTKNQGK